MKQLCVKKWGGYSTTEVDTGEKWIDGKKIYKKVITNLTTPSSEYGNLITLSDHSIDTIISMTGLLTYNSTSSIYIPSYSGASDWGSLYTYNGYLVSRNGAYYRSKPLTIILKYTKTT